MSNSPKQASPLRVMISFLSVLIMGIAGFLFFALSDETPSEPAATAVPESSLVTPIANNTEFMIFGFVGVTLMASVAVMFLVRARGPLQARAARERGISAMATVIDQTPLGGQRFAVKVLVQGAGKEAYEAVIVDRWPAERTPQPGMTLSVKVHPNDPKVVVLAQH